MGRNDAVAGAMSTHNHAGCPYLDQTGYDAVQAWPQVLARIDIRTLSADLQAELRRLQSECNAEELPRVIQ